MSGESEAAQALVGLLADIKVERTETRINFTVAEKKYSLYPATAVNWRLQGIARNLKINILRNGAAALFLDEQTDQLRAALFSKISLMEGDAPMSLGDDGFDRHIDSFHETQRETAAISLILAATKAVLPEETENFIKGAQAALSLVAKEKSLTDSDKAENTTAKLNDSSKKPVRQLPTG